MVGEGTKYRCVQCGHGIRTLFIQYSPGNIRLMKCERCKSVSDEYIEFELMILLIDLILHKTKAYRHLLFNVLLQETVDREGLLWKSALGYLALDAYRSFILVTGEEGAQASLTWISGKTFADVFVGNLILFSVLLFATRSSLTTPAEIFRWRDLVLVILISSYWKIFLFAMMIWEFPSSVVLIVDAFVLSSNAVALKVITHSNTKRCMIGCFAAHAAEFLTTQVVLLLSGQYDNRSTLRYSPVFLSRGYAKVLQRSYCQYHFPPKSKYTFYVITIDGISRISLGNQLSAYKKGVSKLSATTTPTLAELGRKTDVLQAYLFVQGWQKCSSCSSAEEPKRTKSSVSLIPKQLLIQLAKPAKECIYNTTCIDHSSLFIPLKGYISPEGPEHGSSVWFGLL